ncbi:MAG: hypothetical protein AB7O50_09610 [Pseudolabrys sp.]
MSAKYRARVRACRPAGRLGLLVALSALLAACATPAPLSQQANPADADTPAQATGYRPVTSGYVSRRPVAPDDWRGSNDGVAPKKETR